MNNSPVEQNLDKRMLRERMGGAPSMNNSPGEVPSSTPDVEPLQIAHLARDLQLIQRYSFVHSNAPFKSNVPLVGPVIVAVKNAARWILRGALKLTLGSQDEFNAAAANILFEFTRRAGARAPLTLNEAAVDQAIRRLSLSADGREQTEALTLLAREIQVLREQVRAAQLSASESERLASELLRRVAALEDKAK